MVGILGKSRFAQAVIERNNAVSLVKLDDFVLPLLALVFLSFGAIEIKHHCFMIFKRVHNPIVMLKRVFVKR